MMSNILPCPKFNKLKRDELIDIAKELNRTFGLKPKIATHTQMNKNDLISEIFENILYWYDDCDEFEGLKPNTTIAMEELIHYCSNTMKENKFLIEFGEHINKTGEKATLEISIIKIFFETKKAMKVFIQAYKENSEITTFIKLFGQKILVRASVGSIHEKEKIAVLNISEFIRFLT